MSKIQHWVVFLCLIVLHHTSVVNMVYTTRSTTGRCSTAGKVGCPYWRNEKSYRPTSQNCYTWFQDNCIIHTHLGLQQYILFYRRAFLFVQTYITKSRCFRVKITLSNHNLCSFDTWVENVQIIFEIFHGDWNYLYNISTCAIIQCSVLLQWNNHIKEFVTSVIGYKPMPGCLVERWLHMI